jgi:hypothetical protein
VLKAVAVLVEAAGLEVLVLSGVSVGNGVAVRGAASVGNGVSVKKAVAVGAIIPVSVGKAVSMRKATAVGSPPTSGAGREMPSLFGSSQKMPGSVDSPA